MVNTVSSPFGWTCCCPGETGTGGRITTILYEPVFDGTGSGTSYPQWVWFKDETNGLDPADEPAVPEFMILRLVRGLAFNGSHLIVAFGFGQPDGPGSGTASGPVTGIRARLRSNGSEVWTHWLSLAETGTGSGSSPIEDGLEPVAGPVIDESGNIIVLVRRLSTTVTGAQEYYLRQLDQNGNFVWQVRVGNIVPSFGVLEQPNHQAPSIACDGDHIYVALNNNVSGSTMTRRWTVRKFNTLDGTEVTSSALPIRPTATNNTFLSSMGLDELLDTGTDPDGSLGIYVIYGASLSGQIGGIASGGCFVGYPGSNRTLARYFPNGGLAFSKVINASPQSWKTGRFDVFGVEDYSFVTPAVRIQTIDDDQFALLVAGGSFDQPGYLGTTNVWDIPFGDLVPSGGVTASAISELRELAFGGG